MLSSKRLLSMLFSSLARFCYAYLLLFLENSCNVVYIHSFYEMYVQKSAKHLEHPKSGIAEFCSATKVTRMEVNAARSENRVQLL